MTFILKDPLAKPDGWELIKQIEHNNCRCSLTGPCAVHKAISDTVEAYTGVRLPIETEYGQPSIGLPKVKPRIKTDGPFKFISDDDEAVTCAVNRLDESKDDWTRRAEFTTHEAPPDHDYGDKPYVSPLPSVWAVMFWVFISCLFVQAAFIAIALALEGTP